MSFMGVTNEFLIEFKSPADILHPILMAMVVKNLLSELLLLSFPICSITLKFYITTTLHNPLIVIRKWQETGS